MTLPVPARFNARSAVGRQLVCMDFIRCSSVQPGMRSRIVVLFGEIANLATKRFVLGGDYDSSSTFMAGSEAVAVAQSDPFERL